MGIKENKKVKNATEVEDFGIKFRSKFERDVYKAFLKAGYKPEYEKYTFVLLESFRPKDVWYMDGEPQTIKSGASALQESWKYTPDFSLQIGDMSVYIEAKGKPNDVYPYKRKMFLHQLQKYSNVIFIEVHKLSKMKKIIALLDLIKEGRKNNENI